MTLCHCGAVCYLYDGLFERIRKFRDMKNFLVICGLMLGLLLGLSQSASAQNVPGNNNGPGWSNGNNGAPQYPAWVNTGNIPNWAALLVIYEATPTYQQAFGLQYLQLLNKYRIGQLTITILTTNPPSTVTFRVSYGGIDISILIDGL